MVVVPGHVIVRLAASPEPGARWLTLTSILHLPANDPRVAEAHAAVMEDAGVRDLLDRLVPWDQPNRISGHNHPAYAPNLLTLLFDHGVFAADDDRIATCLETMLAHQDPEFRFQALAADRVRAVSADPAAPMWASLPCDHHAIVELLLRAGLGSDERVQRGVDRILATLATTPQGPAWQCRPDPQVRFRGPGRKSDACPQATIEALRALSLVGSPPPEAFAAARTSLAIWRRRGEERPYMFGHGRSFKEGKYPATWYSALTVVDALGRFPDVWQPPIADPADTRAMAEIAACLRAYCLDEQGRVAPRSVFTGFAGFSFGVRGRPSDFATALVVRALARLDPIGADVDAVDVRELTSAKGGTGTALPPRVVDGSK